jgi:hypothetical protein
LASSIKALKSPVSTRAQLVFVALLDEEFGQPGCGYARPSAVTVASGTSRTWIRGMAAW